MNNNESSVTLENDECINLWLEGRDTWNKWVKKNPKANVNFASQNTSIERVAYNHDLDDISFDGYCFPDGHINFSNIDFGNYHVIFASVNFGSGDVNFQNAKFGEGIVDFRDATFGDGKVSFKKTIFGNGEVDFSNANFGKGNVDFKEAKFGDGDVHFEKAIFNEASLITFAFVDFGNLDVDFSEIDFGNCYVSFSQAQFGDGNINFIKSKFGGDVSFKWVNFGNGEVDFLETQFNGDNLDFSYANSTFGRISFTGAKFNCRIALFNNINFSNNDVNFISAIFKEESPYFSNSSFGDANFHRTNFGNGTVNFELSNFNNCSFEYAVFGIGDVRFNKSTFKGHADFSKLTNPNTINSFSFRKATFEKTIDISHNEFNCVVDFTNTSINHQLTLDNLVCNYRRENDSTSNKVVSHDDPPRLRRLKEIAENNKDHELSLEFNAQEMRCKREHNKTKRFDVYIDAAYDKISNYGRSELKPLACLLILWIIFGLLYVLLSSFVNPFSSELFWTKLSNAMSFSGAQILPFVPSSRLVMQEGVDTLFSNDLSPCVHFMATIQSTLSFGLLFLVGLALRNRFRL